MKQLPSWKIREASIDDLEAIRDLYFKVWGFNRPKTFEYWRYATPPLGFCPIAVAVDSNRLVGAYTVWPVQIRVGHNVFPGAQSIDTMTHPDYLGQGIFTQLANECYRITRERGYKLLYGFPNPLSYPGFVKNLGWSHTGDITHWIRLIKPSLHLQVPNIGRPILDMMTSLLPKGSTAGFNIRLEKPNESELSVLLDQWRSKGDACMIEKSSGWLSWRYAPDAENNYRWVSVYKDGNLLAAGVWGKQSTAWGDAADNRAHLVDLFGENFNALKAVLAVVIKEATAENTMVLETLCNLDRICKVLRRVGFYKHRAAPFIVKKLDDTLFEPDPLKHSSWCIIGSDVDTF